MNLWHAKLRLHRGGRVVLLAMQRRSGPKGGSPIKDEDLASALKERFGQQVPVPDTLVENSARAIMAVRGSCRWFDDPAVREDILRALYAIALASP